MQKLVEMEMKRVDLGRLKVLTVFRTKDSEQIIGGKVLDGKIESDSLVEITRDGEIIEKGKVTKLQLNKQDVNSVEENQECGLQYAGKPVIKEGDILVFFKLEETKGQI
jgi:translation initiation factor IF-2